MMIRGHVEARPWKPQDLLDDLQKMIDEEPDAYLNDRRTTLCTARDYLKEYFNTYLPEQKKAIDSGLPLHYYPVYRPEKDKSMARPAYSYVANSRHCHCYVVLKR